jgi:hypothetical protein
MNIHSENDFEPKDPLRNQLGNAFDEQEAFVPDGLWDMIEPAIQPKKKRRGFIFWFWFAALAMSSVGGFYVYMHKHLEIQKSVETAKNQVKTMVDASKLTTNSENIGNTPLTDSAQKLVENIINASNESVSLSNTNKIQLNSNLVENNNYSTEQKGQIASQKDILSLGIDAQTSNLPMHQNLDFQIKSYTSQLQIANIFSSFLVKNIVLLPGLKMNLLALKPIELIDLPYQSEQIKDFLPKASKWLYSIQFLVSQNSLQMQPIKDDNYFIEAIDPKTNPSDFAPSFALSGSVERKISKHFAWNTEGSFGGNTQKAIFRRYDFSSPSLTTNFTTNGDLMINVNYPDSIISESKKWWNIGLKTGFSYRFIQNKPHSIGFLIGISQNANKDFAKVGTVFANFGRSNNLILSTQISYQPDLVQWQYFKAKTVNLGLGIKWIF